MSELSMFKSKCPHCHKEIICTTSKQSSALMKIHVKFCKMRLSQLTTQEREVERKERIKFFGSSDNIKEPRKVEE